MSKNENEGRRSFLKKAALVGGGIAVGATALKLAGVNPLEVEKKSRGFFWIDSNMKLRLAQPDSEGNPSPSASDPIFGDYLGLPVASSVPSDYETIGPGIFADSNGILNAVTGTKGGSYKTAIRTTVTVTPDGGANGDGGDYNSLSSALSALVQRNSGGIIQLKGFTFANPLIDPNVPSGSQYLVNMNPSGTSPIIIRGEGMFKTLIQGNYNGFLLQINGGTLNDAYGSILIEDLSIQNNNLSQNSTTLSESSSMDATVLYLNSASGFSAGQKIWINLGQSDEEGNYIESVNAGNNSITMYTGAHAAHSSGAIVISGPGGLGLNFVHYTTLRNIGSFGYNIGTQNGYTVDSSVPVNVTNIPSSGDLAPPAGSLGFGLNQQSTNYNGSENLLSAGWDYGFNPTGDHIVAGYWEARHINTGGLVFDNQGSNFDIASYHAFTGGGNCIIIMAKPNPIYIHDFEDENGNVPTGYNPRYASIASIYQADPWLDIQEMTVQISGTTLLMTGSPTGMVNMRIRGIIGGLLLVTGTNRLSGGTTWYTIPDSSPYNSTLEIDFLHDKAPKGFLAGTTNGYLTYYQYYDVSYHVQVLKLRYVYYKNAQSAAQTITLPFTFSHTPTVVDTGSLSSQNGFSVSTTTINLPANMSSTLYGEITALAYE